MHRSSSGGGDQPRRSRVLRWFVGVVVTLLVLTVVGLGAIGWYFSGVALAVGSHQPGYGVTVRGVATNGTTVELSSTVDSRRPEPAGLEWPGGYGRLGAIVATTPATVTRDFTPVDGRPAPGLAVSVDPNDYSGDPRTALGLPFTDLGLPSALGTLPAWYVPGDHPQGTWVVFVHGHDGSRRESLRYLPLLHGRGLPVLVATYRNDVGAPPSPDRRDHLGDTEWRDLEPAVRYALAHGARDVVLFGWSMGGAVSLQFADRSTLRDHVRGLVLDSPVIDWRDVLTHQAQLRGLPGPVTAVAEWLVGTRLGTGLDRFDWVSRAGELRRPVLLVHSDADGYVPDGPSRALARARPDLVTFLDIPGADHTRGWNVDPQRYTAGLEAWLGGHGM
jgi:uncharacterized protein